MDSYNQIKYLFDFEYTADRKQLKNKKTSFYTQVLRGERNLKGKIYLMNPKDFLENSFAITDILNEPLRNSTAIEDRLKLNEKFTLPLIDLQNKLGKGRGRVLLCYHAGIEEIPVLICYLQESQVTDYFKNIKGRLWEN